MGCCKLGNMYLEGCELCWADKNHIESIIEYPPEELDLQKWESQPGLHNINSRQVIDSLLLNCKNKIISQSELEDILMSLNYKDFIEENFQMFKENHGYSYLKLAFSSILLGQGTNEDKLYCLFSLIDLDGNQFITKSDMIQSIQALVIIAICESSPQSPYISQLASLKPLAISMLTRELCTFDRISQSELRDLLTSKSHWDLFSSKSLRTWIIGLPQESSQDVYTVNSIRNYPNYRMQYTEETTGLPMTLAHKQPTSSIVSSCSQSSELLPQNVQEEINSSSSDSSGPVCLKVNISPTKQDNFYFYIHEDPVKKAQDFAELHGLSPLYKQKLIKTVEKLCMHIG